MKKIPCIFPVYLRARASGRKIAAALIARVIPNLEFADKLRKIAFLREEVIDYSEIIRFQTYTSYCLLYVWWYIISTVLYAGTHSPFRFSRGSRDEAGPQPLRAPSSITSTSVGTLVLPLNIPVIMWESNPNGKTGHEYTIDSVVKEVADFSPMKEANVVKMSLRVAIKIRVLFYS